MGVGDLEPEPMARMDPVLVICEAEDVAVATEMTAELA